MKKTKVIIVILFFSTVFFSCDEYVIYKLLNLTDERIYISLDEGIDITLEINQQMDTIEGGVISLKPKEKCILIHAINNLDIMDINFNKLIIMNKERDTIMLFSNQKAIFKYFKENKVLEIKSTAPPSSSLER